MSHYIAIIHKENASDYSVSFPDFPGCVTAGSTLAEAFAMAEEALQGHIDVMHEYGDPFPDTIFTLDEAKNHVFAKNAEIFCMVDVDVPIKCRRINITLDDRLIEKIDRISTNRSGFLAEAAREKLRQESRS